MGIVKHPPKLLFDFSGTVPDFAADNFYQNTDNTWVADGSAGAAAWHQIDIDGADYLDIMSITSLTAAGGLTSIDTVANSGAFTFMPAVGMVHRPNVAVLNLPPGVSGSPELLLATFVRQEGFALEVLSHSQDDFLEVRGVINQVALTSKALFSAHTVARAVTTGDVDGWQASIGKRQRTWPAVPTLNASSPAMQMTVKGLETVWLAIKMSQVEGAGDFDTTTVVTQTWAVLSREAASIDPRRPRSV